MIYAIKTGQMKKQLKKREKTAEENTSNGILAKNKTAQPSKAERLAANTIKHTFPIN
jgi:hypothetical protein